MHIEYNAEPTPAKFHKSNDFYRCMRGPVRSGKSTCMCIEIFRRGSEQRPDQRGVRRTRWAVIRNTYRELEDTTMATWKMWFPEEVFGKINVRTMTHHLRFNDVEMDVMFRALDRPDDIKKLLSLELTGAWVNEAREVPKAIIDVLGDRVEQFPPANAEGVTWGGVMMDTNSMDEDHWWYDLEAKPPVVKLASGKVVRWRFFTQPGALIERNGKFFPNPRAENIKNLNGGHDYYMKRLMGKKMSYVRVYYCNQFGYVEEGKRVHPEYNDAVHCSPSPLVPDNRYIVHVGLDYGLTPAAVFGQRRPNGQWWIFKELVTQELGIKRFGELVLKPYINSHLSEFSLMVYEDPWGKGRSQTDEQTPKKILEALDLTVITPNIFGGETLRREALAAPLSRMIDGVPGVLVDPDCRTLRKGLSSKYYFKRVQVVGDDKFQDKPYKNFWSHVCEAAQHMMLGAGEGELITVPQDNQDDYNDDYQDDYSEEGWMAT